MPSPLQQPSARRKVLYFGLILGLFVVNTFFWRGVASPLTGGQPPAWTVAAQADALELREENRGDSDLLGSTVRLGLTGSRGLAVTVLWNAAIDKQMKHEWNELEFIVRSLTKLQPHFLTPWLFQSWNLAYNVSVESDRVRDKYFYISRGIELLAQGERLNRDNPDMRFWLGFYYLNKFGVSDEANTLRSLFQLSCVEPTTRDPALLRRGSEIDEVAFEAFCRKNPQLVRRLHEVLRYTSPADVVDFLADNRKVPTRFVDPALESGLFVGKPGDLKPADQQFPVLPTAKPIRFQSDEPTAADALGDSFDNYQAARAWFSYAQDPLPEPEILSEIKDRRERLAEQKGRRLPRAPAEVIFRQYPARSQSFVGERLQKEGWFDEGGWTIDANRSGLSRWFRGRDVVVGQGVNWSVDAWERAYQMWREDGRRTGMYLDKTDETRLEEQAEPFRKRYEVMPGDPAFSFRPEALDPALARSLLAHRQLAFRQQNLQMTNFAHHYYRADFERDRQAVQARKLMFEADQLRRAAEPERAIETYQTAFSLWKDLLGRDRYRDFRNDSTIQEDMYETEVRYLSLVREHRGAQLRPPVVAAGVLSQGLSALPGAAFPGRPALGLLYGLVTDQRSLPLPVLGPLDGVDASGQPWIAPDVVITVRGRLNMDEVAAAPPTGGPPQAQPRPPPQATTVAP
jgi:hypothetical protein